MASSVVRATVRAVSKRRIQATRAALTLVSAAGGQREGLGGPRHLTGAGAAPRAPSGPGSEAAPGESGAGTGTRTGTGTGTDRPTGLCPLGRAAPGQGGPASVTPAGRLRRAGCRGFCLPLPSWEAEGAPARRQSRWEEAPRRAAPLRLRSRGVPGQHRCGPCERGALWHRHPKKEYLIKYLF